MRNPMTWTLAAAAMLFLAVAPSQAAQSQMASQLKQTLSSSSTLKQVHCRRWWHCHRWGCHRCGW